MAINKNPTMDDLKVGTLWQIKSVNSMDKNVYRVAFVDPTAYRTGATP